MPAPFPEPDGPDSALPALWGGLPIRPVGPPKWPFPSPSVSEALRQVAADGSWGQYHGAHVATLTERLAQYLGCQHVLLCASGTAAIELALRGVPVGAGDEVLLAAYDFKGNFQDVLCVGATPVLVDVRADNWQLDVELVEAALSRRTKAILVSHLHGACVDMTRLRELADRHAIAVIEDACQMPGARVAGRRAGMWGDVGVISFGGSKLLTAGRGGAVFTNRADVAQRIKLYTQRGNEAYPLSELQAAVLLPQLAELDAAHQRRQANVAVLTRLLAGIPGLLPLAQTLADIVPGYYKVGFQYSAEAFGGLDRDRFCQAVRAEGIALDPGFRALHLTHSARRFRRAGSLEQATAADARVVTLHHPVLLGGESDLDEIRQAIEKIRRWACEASPRLDSTSDGAI